MAATVAGSDAAVRALDPSELAQLSSLALRARLIVEGAFAGQHHIPKTGSAIEFAEHKEYAPGDEIRRIDWKVVGRQDRYYVKRFEDETEMRTFLLVDASASMGYRRRGVSKLTYAGYLAAALGYLLGQQGDPAGLAVCDAGLRRYLPPSTRAGHVTDLITTLEGLAPDGKTNLAFGLERIAVLAERRSLVVVMSDLLDAEAEPDAGPAGTARGAVVDALSQLRSRGHDVTVFHLLDPDEVALPFNDLTQFLAVEPDDARALLAEPDDLRDAFAAESNAFRERWRRTCLEARVEYRFTATTAPPSGFLRAFIGDRARA